MPSYLLGIAGIALVMFTFVDALWTTLSQQGAGPFSKRMSRAVWRAGMALTRQWSSSALTRSIGTFALMAAALAWVGMLWAGWVLVFSAEPGVVVRGATGAPADLASRIYFVGYTLFTLGLGTYEPVGPGWEITTAVATFTGLFLVTLTISYLVPVLSAVVSKRSLATALCTLGDTPSDILRRAWNGEDFSALEQVLPTFVPLLNQHAHQHLAYPVIHYFHDPAPEVSLGLPLSRLSEALDVLACGVHESARPSELVLGSARGSIRGFLSTLEGAYIHTDGSPPPPPEDRGLLAHLGVPLLAEPEYRARVADCSDARCLLVALLSDTDKTWTDAVVPHPSDGD